MNDLRTAAQQALEALTPWMDSDHTVQHAAYHALRAALAQQAEPVQEPVAWRDSDNSDPGQGCTYDKAKAARWPHIYKQPLYTAPLQRKPLTEEEIRDLWSWSMTAEAERTATTQQHAFARAIERAHGIGGSNG